MQYLVSFLVLQSQKRMCFVLCVHSIFCSAVLSVISSFAIAKEKACCDVAVL